MRCYLLAAFLLVFIANFAQSFVIKPKPLINLPFIPYPMDTLPNPPGPITGLPIVGEPILPDLIEEASACLSCCGPPPCCHFCG
ncbi:unnamed protein product [Adineta ricciae]|uniref:Uncharacterized protein n=1 Tax=Adineta ricciae TaxID=249248 RepID=A0A814BPG1_ADIRI|nr:unnamed protein product [Adineta ricciae]CAF0929636.1 unnamed protein product [Adineta ricciae]